MSDDIDNTATVPSIRSGWSTQSILHSKKCHVCNSIWCNIKLMRQWERKQMCHYIHFA